MNRDDQLTRIFNTAILSTRAQGSADATQELYALMQSSTFQAILKTVRYIAEQEQISLHEASVKLIETFRKVDQIWSEYAYQEGVEKLRSPSPSPVPPPFPR